MRIQVLALLAVLAMPGVAGAGVVWRGDFESGTLSQYTGKQWVSPDRLQVVTSPVAQGRYALKATVRQGDDPINASGNRNELVFQGPETEGSEYYYRWQVMFPADFPSVRTWQLFTQWHHDGCCGSPPVEFFVYGEEIRLTMTDSVTPWRTKLVRGVWQDFIFRVKWSPDPAVGFIELWHNGQRVLSKRSLATMYAGQGIYLKLGLYRNDTVQPVGVVYHDGFTQGTRLEDVLPPPPAPDAGTPAPPTPRPDAGTPAPPTPAPDAGTPPVPTPEPGAGTPPLPVEGSDGLPPQEPEVISEDPRLPDEPPYGCSSTGGPVWAVALLGLSTLVRRFLRIH